MTILPQKDNFGLHFAAFFYKKEYFMAEIQLAELNALVNGESNMIRIAEERYHANVGTVASAICEAKNLRALLLAGPSGAGKTTTANLISDAVRALGEECIVLSLDDFYLDHADERYPKNERGEHDYERPESLDLDTLRATLASITRGEEFLIPKYDFKVSARVSEKIHPAMPDGCVIIEGLHALNPIISESLPSEKIKKAFVSTSTNINDGEERIISGRKVRFVRRLVRDSIFRGADAARTLGLWQGVLAAEDIYLYPYKHLADFAFDTFHSFELGAMRDRALALLSVAAVEDSEYAKIVKDALSRINAVDSGLIPANSLIREFIGGGIYEKIY